MLREAFGCRTPLLVGAGDFHPGDFFGITVAAGCAVHLLGRRLAGLVLPCIVPVDKSRPCCRVPCRGLSRDCGGYLGADSNLVADVAPTVEPWGVVPAITGVAPHIHLSRSR